MNKKIFAILIFLVFTAIAVKSQDVDAKIDDIKSALINSDYETGLKECEALLQSGVGEPKQLALIYGYAGLSSEALKRKAEALGYYKKAVELQMPQLDV